MKNKFDLEFAAFIVQLSKYDDIDTVLASFFSKKLKKNTMQRPKESISFPTVFLKASFKFK